MDPWVIWLIVALVLGVAELVAGGTLVVGMLAGGALAGAATAAVTDNAFLPWVSFAVVSVGLLVLVRPLAAQRRQQPAELRSGVERLVGQPAEVIAEVDGRDGRVKLQGELWTARSFDGAATFPVGETVHVLQIDGATALVG